jgi:signal transduction histidine kinase
MDGLKTSYGRACSILFPSVLVLASVFSFLQYESIRTEIVDPYGSLVDIRILLLLSVLNVAPLVLFYKRTVNLLFLTIQLVLVLFIITLANNNLTLTVILGTALMFACGYYLRRPVNLAFTIAAAVSILAFQRSIPVGDTQTPTINSHELFMLGFLCLLVTALSYVISSIIESHELLTETIREQKNTIATLVETNVGIQRYALVKKDEFESAERLRITRDIHDTVGWVLTNNITLLRACTYYVPRRLKKAHAFLKDALSNAQNGLKETRNILKKLRAINEAGRAAEVRKMIRLFMASTGIEVRYTTGNTHGTWSKGLDYVFYRIIQEGLVNSVKHGKASRIDVSFWQTDADVVLNISDNGVGTGDGDVSVSRGPWTRGAPPTALP